MRALSIIYIYVRTATAVYTALLTYSRIVRVTVSCYSTVKANSYSTVPMNRLRKIRDVVTSLFIFAGFCQVVQVSD